MSCFSSVQPSTTHILRTLVRSVAPLWNRKVPAARTASTIAARATATAVPPTNAVSPETIVACATKTTSPERKEAKPEEQQDSAHKVPCDRREALSFRPPGKL
jgi:hypothetical protein